MSQGYKGTDLNWHPEASWIRQTLLECLERGGTDLQSFQFVKKEEDLQIEDLSDGNLNHVLRVSSKTDPSKSVIFKHAPPYLKVIGSGYPLADDRGDQEYRALVQFHKACPGSVVEPLGYHAENKVLCMVDYPNYTVYRKCLLAGNADTDIARKLAREIAIVHRKTHVATLGQTEFDKIVQDFDKQHVIGITDDFVFTKPFTRGDPTNRVSKELDSRANSLYDNEDLQKVIHKMHKLFHEKKEALIHGDLHTGSALVDVIGKDIRMFDVEFAMVGPCAMDLGLLIANYIFCYYYHLLNPEDNDSHRQVAYKIVDICDITVDEYLLHMSCSVGDRQQYVEQLISETAGFAGCEILRRLLGAGRVEDMDSLECAQPDCFEAGCRLLRACHQIRTVSQMMNVALMLTF